MRGQLPQHRLYHEIRVLSHCAEKISVVDKVHDRVRFIEANADDACIAGCLDGITGTGRGTFVTAEDTNNALCDVVLSDGLGLRRVTFAILVSISSKSVPSNALRNPASLLTVESVAAFTFTIPILPDVTPASLSAFNISFPAVVPAASLSVEKVASASTLPGSQRIRS